MPIFTTGVLPMVSRMLSNFATPEIDSFAEIRRTESAAAVAATRGPRRSTHGPPKAARERPSVRPPLLRASVLILSRALPPA